MVVGQVTTMNQHPQGSSNDICARLDRTPRSFLMMLRVGLTCSAVISGSTCIAGTLGVYGNVWDIAEKSAIDQIKGRLSAMERDGSLKKRLEAWRDDTINGLVNQPPVDGIATASRARVWSFDPSVIYGNDVFDQNGRLLVPGGTTINPLNHISLTKGLLFIDARDIRQVALAKKHVDTHPRDKVILVAGSWVQLQKAWKRQVYFDQRGMLSKRFGLKYVPALIVQKGRVLEVQEILP